MINKLKPKSEFSKNVLTLMTGTTIAQAIPIAISPILTRIYTPQDFGVFAIYMSLASILSVFVTGRYELAILLPKENLDAFHVVILSNIISLFISLMIFLFVLIFNNKITILLGNPQISVWLYFIPVTVFLTGIYQSLNFWNNRNKRYKRLSINRVVQSGTSSTISIGVGLFRTGNTGLIVGFIFGQIVSTFALARKFIFEYKFLFQNIQRSRLYLMLKRYQDFPKYDIPASLFNTLSQQLIPILMTVFFNPAITGYYYFTQKTMNIPVSLISSAVLDVFKAEATSEYNKSGNAKNIYKSTFKKLFFLSIFPSLLMYLFAVDIFTFVFGLQWKISGEYAEVLTPMLFLRFVSNPLSFMYYIAERQRLNLYLQLLLLIMILISFYISNVALENVKFISLSFSIFYILHLFFSAKIAGIFQKDKYA